MNKAEQTLKILTPELLKILNSPPEFGSIGISVTIHDNKPVKIDSSRTVTLKLSKGGYL